MADKNVLLKDGNDYLFPKTKAGLVEGLSSKIDEATAGFLPLSGGTMTGALKIGNSSNAYIKSTNNYDVLRASGSGTSADVVLGNNQGGSRATIITGGSYNVTHQRGSMQYEMLDDYNTSANPTLAGTEGEVTSLKLNSTSYALGKSVSYLTTAPSSANTSGRLQFVVLSSEPATKYDGYLYIITGA